MKKLVLILIVVLLAGCGDPNYQPAEKSLIHILPNFNNISSNGIK